MKKTKREAIIDGDIVRMPLTKGQEAVVDREDYERLPMLKGNWQADYRKKNGTYYPVKRIASRKVYLHRYVIDAPEGLEVDHINNNPLDCRKENLRLCSRIENCRNIRKLRQGLTSKYKGVIWSKEKKAWRAELGARSIKKSLGYFDSEEDAARAYDAAALATYRQYCSLNFPNDPIRPELLSRIRGKNRKATSKYLGVYWNKLRNKWYARLKKNDKEYCLGSYTSEEDAARVYDAKHIELYGNAINFPN